MCLKVECHHGSKKKIINISLSRINDLLKPNSSVMLSIFKGAIISFNLDLDSNLKHLHTCCDTEIDNDKDSYLRVGVLAFEMSHHVNDS